MPAPLFRKACRVSKREIGSRAKQMPTARISAASHGPPGLSFPAFLSSPFPPPLPRVGLPLRFWNRHCFVAADQSSNVSIAIVVDEFPQTWQDLVGDLR